METFFNTFRNSRTGGGILSFCIAVSIVLSSCSSTKNQFLKKEYQEKEFNSSLLIIPIDDYFELTPSDENYRALSEEDRRNFNALFGLVFQDYTSADTYGIDPELELNKEKFSPSILSLNNSDSFSIILPKGDAEISFYDYKIDYLLLIQEYYISYISHDVPKSLSLQSGQQGKQYLVLKTKYAIWDNTRHETVGWGSVEARVNFEGTLNREVYLGLIGRVSEKIIRKSPFQLKHF